MEKDKVLKANLFKIQDSVPNYVDVDDLAKIMRDSEEALEEYAKYRLEQFIDEHFSEYSLKAAEV